MAIDFSNALKAAGLQDLIQYKAIKPYQSPSPIRISTISALAFLNEGIRIDLDRLYDSLRLVDADKLGVTDIKTYEKINFTDGRRAEITQLHRQGMAGGELLHMKRVKSHFQNQVTLIWTFRSSTGHVRRANAFMFNNGKIKAVGLKTSDDILLSYTALVQYFKDQRHNLRNVFIRSDISTTAATEAATDPSCTPPLVQCVGQLLARILRQGVLFRMTIGRVDDVTQEALHNQCMQLISGAHGNNDSIRAHLGRVLKDHKEDRIDPLLFIRHPDGLALFRGLIEKERGHVEGSSPASFPPSFDMLDSLALRAHPRPTMYNTDFSCGFKIMRDELFRIIVQKYFLSKSEYEPDIYPAVKVKFSFNRLYMDRPVVGICYCKNRDSCEGSGSGEGEGCCKTVTACLFQTGKVIITGGNTYEQVEYVYAYVNNIIRRHYEDIYYKEPIIIESDDAKKGVAKKTVAKKPISKKAAKKAVAKKAAQKETKKAAKKTNKKTAGDTATGFREVAKKTTGIKDGTETATTIVGVITPKIVATEGDTEVPAQKTDAARDSNLDSPEELLQQNMLIVPQYSSVAWTNDH